VGEFRHLFAAQARCPAIGARRRQADLVWTQARPAVPQEAGQLLPCHAASSHCLVTGCPWQGAHSQGTVVAMNDRTALVTGANKGIGKHIARLLAAEASPCTWVLATAGSDSEPSRRSAQAPACWSST
jgi:hypothetical protein